MEKYFIVSEACPLNKDYFTFKTNTKEVNLHVNVFTKEHGIEASAYHASNDVLYIVPTEKDIKNFDNFLAKPLANGLRAFKKNSKIGKAWIGSLKKEGLRVFGKPMVGFYFKNVCGRFKTRLFDINGTVYCSIEQDGNIDTPEGMKEIKASEFFKAIEDDLSST